MENTDGFTPGARPICVFCNAPWTEDMIKGKSRADTSCGYYGDTNIDGINTVIDITCESCKRLIYRKEISTYEDRW